MLNPSSDAWLVLTYLPTVLFVSAMSLAVWGPLLRQIRNWRVRREVSEWRSQARVLDAVVKLSDRR